MTKPATARPVKNDFAVYCCELLSGAGPCTAKRMFGGFGISTSGMTLALISDLGSGERLWLKADAQTRGVFEAAGCKRFSYDITKNGERSEHSLNYYSAPDEAMESPQLMLQWARLSLDCAAKARAAKLPRGKPRSVSVTKKASKAAATLPPKPPASRPKAAAAKPSAPRKSAKG